MFYESNRVLTRTPVILIEGIKFEEEYKKKRESFFIGRVFRGFLCICSSKVKEIKIN